MPRALLETDTCIIIPRALDDWLRCMRSPPVLAACSRCMLVVVRSSCLCMCASPITDANYSSTFMAPGTCYD
eukprot:9503696-Pyramimonas_sp.AAC.1